MLKAFRHILTITCAVIYLLMGIAAEVTHNHTSVSVASGTCQNDLSRLDPNGKEVKVELKQPCLACAFSLSRVAVPFSTFPCFEPQECCICSATNFVANLTVPFFSSSGRSPPEFIS